MENSRNQMHKVEIKSKALLREGQKGFITYFKGGTHEQIISDCRQLYPQYMMTWDDPVVNITAIDKKQYDMDRNTKRVNEKQKLIQGQANIMKMEDYDNDTLPS